METWSFEQNHNNKNNVVYSDPYFYFHCYFNNTKNEKNKAKIKDVGCKITVQFNQQSTEI